MIKIPLLKYDYLKIIYNSEWILNIMHLNYFHIFIFCWSSIDLFSSVPSSSSKSTIHCNEENICSGRIGQKTSFWEAEQVHCNQQSRILSLQLLFLYLFKFNSPCSNLTITIHLCIYFMHPFIYLFFHAFIYKWKFSFRTESDWQ